MKNDNYINRKCNIILQTFNVYLLNNSKNLHNVAIHQNDIINT